MTVPRMLTIRAQNDQDTAGQNSYVLGAAKRNWDLTITSTVQNGTVPKIQWLYVQRAEECCFTLGSSSTSLLGASCFLPYFSPTLLIMTNQKLQSQKDHWQCWRGTVRRLLYEKQHDVPQNAWGIEQRRDQVSLQEVLQGSVSQKYPVNIGVVENHGIFILVLYMSSAWYSLIGESLWSNVEELHNYRNVGPINNFLPFLSLS